jgi:hypothetical protein
MRQGIVIASVALLLAAATALGVPYEFVENGDFEDDLSVGWTERIMGSGGSLQRLVGQDEDPDYELYARMASGDGVTSAYQRFAVPSVDLVLSANLNCYAFGDNGAWSVAGLMIGYRDQDFALLGETAVAALSRDCPWTDGPTFHCIPAGEAWEFYEVDIAAELLNLPGVDPERVAFLEIAVLCQADNC